MSKAIGIDLGTTNSCVAYYHNDKCDVIANDQGSRTTPSMVAFTDSEHLIGEAAKTQAGRNLNNTVFDTKRMIGHLYDDPVIEDDKKYYPFEVVNKAGKPAIKVEYKGETKVLSPEEISAMILANMKETAEAFIGSKVNNAVVTVPAYFNNSQRQATINAAKLADLNVLKIINEPTAAAIAYGLIPEVNIAEKRNMLVFDLGGGTFDLSLLSVEGCVLRVMATAGDTHLGGKDFDNRLVEHFIQEFKRQTGKDITGNQKAIRKLRNACEPAKRTLSWSTQAAIEIDALFEGDDFYTSITRVKFEELCGDLFDITIDLAEQVLKDANVDKSEVDEVVLVGGSTRIPKIRSLLSAFLDDMFITKSINPDEAVAYGAAVQAAKLVGDNSAQTQDLVVMDVTPLSIGIRLHGGIMSNVVPRNAPIPSKFTNTFVTIVDYQEVVRVRIFEGERAMTADNNYLGELTLHDIKPVRAGVIKVDVTFELNANGVMTVSAVERGTNNSKKVTINHDKSRFLPEEIERMVVEAKLHKERDDVEIERVRAKNAFATFAISLRKSMIRGPLKDKLSAGSKQTLKESVDNALSWLQNSPNATKREYADRKRELERVVNPIVDPIEASSDDDDDLASEEDATTIVLD